MEVLKLMLDVLKFGAIGVGSVSGIIGALTKTRDEATGKPTSWGRWIVALIAAAAVIAVASQSVESYLKRISDAEADQKTSAILGAAEKTANDTTTIQQDATQSLEVLGKNVEETSRLRDEAENMKRDLEQQRASISKTVAGIQGTARSLKSVLSMEEETRFSLTHQLGELQVKLVVRYPIMNMHFLESTWWEGIQLRAKQIKGNVVLAEDAALSSISIEPRSFSSPEGSTPTDLFRGVGFLIVITRRPFRVEGSSRFGLEEFAAKFDAVVDFAQRLEAANAKKYAPQGVDLAFKTDRRIHNFFEVDINTEAMEQTILSNTVKLRDTNDITSWLQLYGANVVIFLPRAAPADSEIEFLELDFGHTGRRISMKIDSSMRRRNLSNGIGSDICFVVTLSEKELGPKPDIAHTLRATIESHVDNVAPLLAIRRKHMR